MTQGAVIEQRILRYICERCTLYYAERWSADAMPHPWLGLCPRCDAFNKPTVDADQRSISEVTEP